MQQESVASCLTSELEWELQHSRATVTYQELKKFLISQSSNIYLKFFITQIVKMIYEKSMTQFTLLSFLVTLDFSVARCQSS